MAIDRRLFQVSLPSNAEVCHNDRDPPRVSWQCNSIIYEGVESLVRVGVKLDKQLLTGTCDITNNSKPLT